MYYTKISGIPFILKMWDFKFNIVLQIEWNFMEQWWLKARNLNQKIINTYILEILFKKKCYAKFQKNFNFKIVPNKICNKLKNHSVVLIITSPSLLNLTRESKKRHKPQLSTIKASKLLFH